MLSGLNYYLDYLIKFFFINSKGKSLIFTSNTLDGAGYRCSRTETYSANEAKKIYDYQIRKYLGFGFWLSFIPFTHACRARVDYFKNLLVLHKKIERELPRSDIYGYYVHLVGITPFYFLDRFIENFYQNTATAKVNIVVNVKRGWALLFYLPLVTDIFIGISHSGKVLIYDGWYRNVLRTLFNPGRLISDTLRFLHRSVDTFFELGARQGSDSSIFRILLKGLSATIFLPLRLAAGLIENTIDLVVLKPLYKLLVEPAKFAFRVIKQLVNTFSKKDMYVPAAEFNAVQSLAQAVDKPLCDDKIMKSSRHVLQVLSSRQIKAYKKERDFYRKIKNRSEFKDIANFNYLAKDKMQELTWLHDNFDNYEKTNLFGMFARSSKWTNVSSVYEKCEDPAADVLKLVTQKFIDLSVAEKETNHEMKRQSI